MKRDTRAWLRKFDAPEYNFSRVSARDVLDSHARQRSEIRDLRARLKAVASIPWSSSALRAFDLKNKKWRKA